MAEYTDWKLNSRKFHDKWAILNVKIITVKYKY